MKENEKKAFDFASDVSKQLITLSTAIITITITFLKDITNVADNFLLLAWILYIATIFFGIWTLMALTGSLQPIEKKKKSKLDKETLETDTIEKSCSINAGNIRLPSMLQIACFIGALILTTIYGYNSLKNKESEVKEPINKNELRIIRTIEYSVSPELTIDTLIVK